MKRALILIIALMMVFALAACAPAQQAEPVMTSMPTDAPTAAQQADDTPAYIPETFVPIERLEGEGSSVAMMYTDHALDIVIVIYAMGWTYSKDVGPGSVYFYPAAVDPAAYATGILLTKDELHGSAQTAEETVAAHIADTLTDVEWSDPIEVPAGSAVAQGRSFTAAEYSGAYFVWQTQYGIYICQLTAEEQDFEQTLDLTIRSLEKTASIQALEEAQQ